MVSSRLKLAVSQLFCGFWEGCGNQHAILHFVENCKKSMDSGGVASAVLTDLSKAFDCLNYELLIIKLNAHDFSTPALLFIHNYLTNRKQRVKVNGSFSTWTKTLFGVLQSSVLGPLLLNIYLNYLLMFLEETKVCNLADDAAIYACDPKIEAVIAYLEHDILKLTKWFLNNFMKLNEDKYHLMFFGRRGVNEITLKIGEARVKDFADENLLGITFDQSLSLKKHVKTLCRQAGQKLRAFALVFSYMDTEKLKYLMRAFVITYFSYCPLLWMFYDRTMNHGINHFLERALNIAY